jgi:hypothetical protein
MSGYLAHNHRAQLLDEMSGFVALIAAKRDRNRRLDKALPAQTTAAEREAAVKQLALALTIMPDTSIARILLISFTGLSLRGNSCPILIRHDEPGSTAEPARSELDNTLHPAVPGGLVVEARKVT